MLFDEGFVDLVLDDIFVHSQIHLARHFALQSQIVPVELSFDPIVGADVADPLNGLTVGFLNCGVESFRQGVLEQARVVMSRRSRSNGYVALVALGDQLGQSLDVLGKDSQVGKLVDPVFELVACEGTGLH